MSINNGTKCQYIIQDMLHSRKPVDKPDSVYLSLYCSLLSQKVIITCSSSVGIERCSAQGSLLPLAVVANYQVSSPNTFTCREPEEGPKWIRRFKRFRIASGLNMKSNEMHFNTHI